MARLFGEKRFRGTTESDCEDEVIFALRNKSLSPWSWKFFELVRLKAGKVGGGGAAVMMHKWLSLVATAFPGCLLNLTCHSLSIRSVGTLKTTGLSRTYWTKLNSYFRQKTINGVEKRDLCIFFRS